MHEECLNLLKANQDHEYAADSFDRELVRDLMIEKYQLEWKN